MITHSQARSMAEARWGRGGTRSTKTNRTGAFYFSCSGHGGFVIDARCLSAEERARIEKYIAPEQATEVYRVEDNRVVKFRGPDSFRTLKYYSGSQSTRQVEIFFAEEDCDWAVPGVLAGIFAKGAEYDEALASFIKWQKPSNHEILALNAQRLDLVSDQAIAA